MFCNRIFLHKCILHTVLVSFDVGILFLLQSVSKTFVFRVYHILCVDNDIKEDDSSMQGIEKITAVALAIDDYLAIPCFNGKKFDWNTLHVKMGIDEVLNQCICYKNQITYRMLAHQISYRLDFLFVKWGSSRPLAYGNKKDNGYLVKAWIGPPLYIEGITCDNYRKLQRILSTWKDLENRIHTWAMPKALFENKEFLFGVVVLLMKDGVALLEAEHESFQLSILLYKNSTIGIMCPIYRMV